MNKLGEKGRHAAKQLYANELTAWFGRGQQAKEGMPEDVRMKYDGIAHILKLVIEGGAHEEIEKAVQHTLSLC